MSWRTARQFIIAPVSMYVLEMLATFKGFPPRFEAPSYSLSKALEMVQTAQG